MTFGLYFGSRATVERQSAFLMDPRDLRQRLALAPEPALPPVPSSPRLLPSHRALMARAAAAREAVGVCTLLHGA